MRWGSTKWGIIDIPAVSVLIFIEKGRSIGKQAYGVKCCAKREMKGAKSITMNNGKTATQSLCRTCGIKMFRIGKG